VPAWVEQTIAALPRAGDGGAAEALRASGLFEILAKADPLAQELLIQRIAAVTGFRRSLIQEAVFQQLAVQLARAAGLPAKRVLASGASGHLEPSLAGDVQMAGLGRCQAKLAKSGYTTLYRDLGGAEALIIRQDRHRPLVVLELARLLALLKRGPLPYTEERSSRGSSRRDHAGRDAAAPCRAGARAPAYGGAGAPGTAADRHPGDEATGDDES